MWNKLPIGLLSLVCWVGCATDDLGRSNHAGVGLTTICHVADDTTVSITVGDPAVNTHLAHGDTLGACGTGVTQTIGQQGGTIDTGTIVMTIPEGALNEDVTITVTDTGEAAPTEYDPVTSRFTFEPAGLRFSMPVAVTFPAPEPAPLTVYWSLDDGSGDFEPIGGTIDGNTITAHVLHFSQGFVARPAAANNPRSVRGVAYTRWLSDDNPTGFSEPIDLTGLSVSALVDDGMGGVTEIPGTGHSNGNFTIKNVPAGSYNLRVFSDYLVTSESTIDLGSIRLGRSDQSAPTGSTPLNISISGLEAWQDDDSLELYSTNANAWYFTMEANADTPPTAGDTTASFQVDTFTALGGATNLMDGVKLDNASLVQLSSRSPVGGDDPGFTYQTLTRVVDWNPVPFVQPDGGANTLTGALVPVASTRTTQLDWRQTLFAGPTVLQQIHPDGFTLPSFGNVGGVVQLPHSDQFGHYSSSLDLMLLRGDENAPQDFRTGVMELPQFSGAFANSTPVVIGSGGVIVAYSLGPGFETHQLGSVRTEIAFGPGYAGEEILVAPTVTPPLSVTIAGVDAQTNQQNVGTTPIVAWTPGATTPTTSYSLIIFRLTYDGNGTQQAIHASFQTTATSVTIPDGILVEGESYYAAILATDLPNRDPQKPRHGSFPNTTATTLTSIFSPTSQAGVASCDIFDAGSCAAGEKCAIHTTNYFDDPGQTLCAPAGLQVVGATCSFSPDPDNFDNCVSGAHCTSGGCRVVCMDDGACNTGAGENCALLPEGQIGVCVSGCDPISQDCPTPGDACYFDVTVSQAICAPSQGAIEGSACSLHGECAAGLACENDPSSGSRTCQQLCDLSAPSCPGNGFCEDQGSGFVGVCRQLACNALDQTGCNAGEKCSLATSDPYDDPGTLVCAPEGLQVEGGVCGYGADPDLFDDCAGGLHCLSGGCETICHDDSECTPGSSCAPVHEGLVQTCVTPCDPVAQDCAGGEACYFDQSVGQHVCAPTQGASAGTSCAVHGDCGVGLSCERDDATGQRVCMAQCDLSASSCSAGEFCADTGGGIVGVCKTLPCDPVTQTDCAGSEKCAIQTSDIRYDPGTLTCLPNGSQAIGDLCAPATGGPDFDDCVAGGHCVEGQCAATCWVDADCTSNTCRAPHGGILRVCIDPCDAFSPGACSAGDSCYFDDTLGEGVCLPTGSSPSGAECTIHIECTDGTGCHDDGASSTGRSCQPYF